MCMQGRIDRQYLGLEVAWEAKHIGYLCWVQLCLGRQLEDAFVCGVGNVVRG